MDNMTTEKTKRPHDPIGPDVQTWFDEEEKREPGFIAGIDLQLTKEAIAAHLKALRLGAGLSQSEVAKRAGILQPSLARIESGRMMPQLELVTRIASALGHQVELRLVKRSQGKRKDGKRQ